MADTQAKRDIRRQRIAEAQRTAAKGETIGLAELAKVWGVGKPAFVNTRDLIPSFPPATINGKEYLYPRIEALAALDAWERRADAANAQRADRIAALIGFKPDDDNLSISDLQKAYNLGVELEQRMIAQGQLVPRSEVNATAGKVFQLLSRFLSDLGTTVDPNGQFPPAVREAADKGGQDLLLRIHAEMRDMLTPHAQRTAPPSPNGKRARRS